MGLIKKVVDLVVSEIPFGDKVLHFLAGSVMTFLFSFLVSADLAFGFAVVIGLAKEIRDLYSSKGTNSLFDWIATVAGALLVYLVI